MPFPTPPPWRPPGPYRSRRGLLAGALRTAAGATAAAALTSCSDDGSARPGRDERSRQARKLREQAARESDALLARYEATASAHPGLAERLRPLRAEVARHAEAFGAARRQPTASPTASPAASGSPAPAVPKEEKAALGALADAERRTADARARALLDAPPELARLLASVAAAGAAHAYLLTEKR